MAFGIEAVPPPVVDNLGESEDNFAAVFKHLPVMAWYCRVDRCRAVVSPAWERYTGRFFADGSWRDCIHPAEVGCFDDLTPVEAAAEGHLLREVRIRSAKGEYRWHEVRASPVCHALGTEPEGWMFTATDIENRRRFSVERAQHIKDLRAIEERFVLATSAGGVGVFDTDLIANRIVWTGKLGEMAGLDVFEMPQSRDEAYEAVHPDDRVAARSAFDAAVARGDDEFRGSFRGVRADGQVCHIVSQCRIIRDENGTALRAVGTVVDVTAPYLAKRALLESQQRLQATYDNAGVGIAEIDRNGVLVRVNDTWIAYTGCAPDAALGSLFWDTLVDLHERDEAKAQFALLVAGEIDAFDGVRIGERADGTRFWYDTTTSAVRDEEGRFLYAVRVKRDITEHHVRREQERLLLAELTHRVKNTVATIQSISSQTIGTAETLHAFHERFMGRLHSISAIHSLLIDQNWLGTGFGEVLGTEIGMHRTIHADRWAVGGPILKINPSAAVNIGLLMHELVSNATRFGSLSNDHGRVHVLWNIIEEDGIEKLALSWRETGGPAVVPPTTKGFGTRLLTSFTRQLGGAYRPQYEPEGFRTEIVIPTNTIRMHEGAGLMRI